VTNFTVDVGSMDSAATTIHRTQVSAEAVYSGLHELDIPHGTFGRVPWLSDKIAQPYEAHVKACSDSYSNGRRRLCCPAGSSTRRRSS